MTNYKLTLCYDGSRYRGWQRQGNCENSIQALVERALSRLLEQEIEVSGSGRTDAGVHARRQVCSFRAETPLTPEELLARLRAVLPEDVGALALEQAPPRFHARLSCTEKTYVYRIWNSPLPDVFERKYRLALPEQLDEAAMRRAADLLCGEHDFAAFCSLKHPKKSTVRELRRIGITREGDELRLSFTGDGFLYNMVRILTGTLLEVGMGQRSADDMSEILASRSRENAGPTAPAKGLILWELRYDGRAD